jgi:hypothetical protein
MRRFWLVTALLVCTALGSGCGSNAEEASDGALTASPTEQLQPSPSPTASPAPAATTAPPTQAPSVGVGTVAPPPGAGQPPATQPPPATAPTEAPAVLPQPVELARQHLATRLSVQPGAIGVVSMMRMDWQDSCLGLGGPAEICAQVITPGYLVIFSSGGATYEYHTDLQTNFRAAS